MSLVPSPLECPLSPHHLNALCPLTIGMPFVPSPLEFPPCPLTGSRPGAENGFSRVPAELVDGLVARAALKEEVEAFLELVTRNLDSVYGKKNVSEAPNSSTRT